MISVTRQMAGDRIVGFTYDGHADYADYGQDIVCSAVTAQLMMAYNGLETVLGIPLDLDMDESGGYFAFRLQDLADAPRASILMETLELGLTAIHQQYKDNITLKIEEV